MLLTVGMGMGMGMGVGTMAGPEPAPARSALTGSVQAVALTPAYIGAERCKLCHRAVYESWRLTPHASTSVPEDRAEARCAACHETGTEPEPEPESGGGGPSRVGCEACHGPGGDYWPAEVMIDPEKASMAGLVRPAASVCVRCHENDEPGHRDLVLPARPDWPSVVHPVGEP